MMLDFLGQGDAGHGAAYDAILRAIESVLVAGPRTADVGGTASTSEPRLAVVGVFDAVVRDEDPQRKQARAEKLRLALATAGIAGQQFTPQPGSLTLREQKQQYVTEEGVTITFEGRWCTIGVH